MTEPSTLIPTQEDREPCRTCNGNGGVTEESGYGVYVSMKCPTCFAISESMGPDWNSHTGARYVADALFDEGIIATARAQGRSEGIEEAARVADFLGGDRERPPLRDGDDKNARSDRMTRAQHVRAKTIATAIRRLMAECPWCADQREPGEKCACTEQFKDRP